MISLTGNGNSTLAKYSDVHIKIAITKEACPLGLAPTSSTTAMLAVGDAISVVLMLMKGFSSEDFAFFHPGGALGKKLLVKVEDLMHKGDDIPLVTDKEKLRNVILEISEKRLGIAGVVNESGNLIGCISDGDLRRAIKKYDNKIFELISADIMSKNPKKINRDSLAVKALKIMEDNSITSLFVEDEKENIVGIIHIHDILKEGIT